MKTILITGINGFLGSHLAKQLSKSNKVLGIEYDITKCDNLKDVTCQLYETFASLNWVFFDGPICIQGNKIFASKML